MLLPASAAAELSTLDFLRQYANISDDVQITVPTISRAVASENITPVRASNTLSGDSLFQQLSIQAQPDIRRHAFSYGSAKSFMYGKADQTNCQGRKGILTFYSQICTYGNGGDGNSYKEHGDENEDGIVDKLVNAEHLWPQSFFGKASPMVADLHHIQSTFQTPNGRRSNFPFCETRSKRYSTSSGSKLSAERNCYEPANQVKGNVARAMFYFVTVYHDKSIRQGGCNYNEFWTNNVEMFLRWNRQDPPDAQEKHRNDLIEQFQGNRNPYVDDYTLADRVGAATFKKY